MQSSSLTTVTPDIETYVDWPTTQPSVLLGLLVEDEAAVRVTLLYETSLEPPETEWKTLGRFLNSRLEIVMSVELVIYHRISR